MAETATCDHDWQWLPRLLFALDLDGKFKPAANVECAECGVQAWAHGIGPTRPEAYPISTTPTTGRS